MKISYVLKFVSKDNICLMINVYLVKQVVINVPVLKFVLRVLRVMILSQANAIKNVTIINTEIH